MNADKLFDEIVCINRVLPEINKTGDMPMDIIKKSMYFLPDI
jgi:hypothetical protein